MVLMINKDAKHVANLATVAVGNNELRLQSFIHRLMSLQRGMIIKILMNLQEGIMVKKILMSLQRGMVKIFLISFQGAMIIMTMMIEVGKRERKICDETTSS